MSGNEHHKPQPTMSGAARYQIRVRGHVDDAAARRLRGLEVENAEDHTGAPVALLRGELPDQAALIGVLHTLNDYQLPLLAAEYQPSGGDGGTKDRWHPLSLPATEAPESSGPTAND